MQPTSPARAPLRASTAKAGFTLLEMLFTLAIMGLTAALVMPRVRTAIASNGDHAEVFHFQRLMLDLRATAYHEERALKVVDTGQFKDDPDADPQLAEIKLDDGWSYRLSGPLTISPRGLCDVVTVDLFHNGRPRERLTGSADCSYSYARLD